LRSLEGYQYVIWLYLVLVCWEGTAAIGFSLCDLTCGKNKCDAPQEMQEQIKGNKLWRENPNMQPVGRAWPHQLNLFLCNAVLLQTTISRWPDPDPALNDSQLS
jgi:hypothetical protein